MTSAALPYDLYEEDDESTLWAIRAGGQMTRGQARSIITRTREVPFTSGTVKVAWLKRDGQFIASAQPHEKDAAPYWCYAGC